ncbi:MAG: ABC transporter substrate-binding protein, partial [Pseudomonadota bacterium]
MSKDLRHLTDLIYRGKLDRRGFITRATALGASTAMASGLWTQASADAHATPKKGGTIRLATPGGATTDNFDPALAAETTAVVRLRHWGDPLVELAPTGGLEARIAESWEASADAKTWTFKIREGVTFSNGKTLTPEDVMATIERHAGEESKSGALGLLRDIASMKVDGQNFVVELKGGNADLPYYFSDYHLMIQPNGGKDDPNAAIGTGAYTVAEFEHGVRYVYQKRDDYWGDLGNANTIEHLVINDDTARVAAIQSGQVDLISRVPPKVASLVNRAPNIDVRTSSGPGHYVFIMHTDTAPFDNNDLRLALKYAMNRQEMVDKILFGFGSVGNDTPINASYPLFSSEF